MSTPTWGQQPQYPGSGPAGQASFGQPQQGGYGQPPQGGFGQPPQQSSYGQPPAQGSYGQPQQGSFGQPPQQGSFGQPQQGSYGQPASPYAQPTPTMPLPFGASGQPAPAGPQAGSRKRPGAGLWIGLGAGALVLLLVLGAVIGEFVTRGNVNGQLQAKADAIATSLAEGVEIEGSFTPSVEGFSYLTQQLAGRYDHITFAGHDLTLDGAPARLTFDAYGVPSDLAGAATRIQVDREIPADAFVAWLASQSASEDNDFTGMDDVQVTFNDGSVTVRSEYPELQTSFEYTYELRAENGVFVSQMTGGEMVLFGSSIDLSADDPVELPMCDGVADVQGEALDLAVTTEGITQSWAVTGGGATLDNLGAIGGCA